MRNLGIKLAAIVGCLALAFGCAKENNEPAPGGNGSGNTTETPVTPDNPDNPETPLPPVTLIKGADISWLSEMEHDGISFYYPDGRKGDCMEILKSLGINTFRFRLWVNPEENWNSTADVTAKAARAKALGMHIMLSLHYSDSWADPGQQTVPAAWKGLDLAALEQRVKDYTRSVMISLKEAGITPEWVQIGNETGNGMLWPYGKADSNPAGYVRLNNAGYEGLKEVFPDATAIVHVQNAQDKYLAVWLMDILKNGGGKFDAIGLSLYPEPGNWQTMLADAEANMKNLVSRYGCPVALCEVGMGNSYVSQCRSFLDGCIALQTKLPDGKYLGVLYWEPEVYNDWKGYRLGAFTSAGRPSAALDAFK